MQHGLHSPARLWTDRCSSWLPRELSTDALVCAIAIDLAALRQLPSQSRELHCIDIDQSAMARHRCLPLHIALATPAQRQRFVPIRILFSPAQSYSLQPAL